MLKRHYRLPAQLKLSPATFIRTPLFSLKYSKNTLDYSRFGFVIRKASEKHATGRNRIKRVFRSCIEEQLGTISPGYDMLFLLERGILEKTQDELCVQLMQTLKAQHLLKDL